MPVTRVTGGHLIAVCLRWKHRGLALVLAPLAADEPRLPRLQRVKCAEPHIGLLPGSDPARPRPFDHSNIRRKDAAASAGRSAGHTKTPSSRMSSELGQFGEGSRGASEGFGGNSLGGGGTGIPSPSAAISWHSSPLRASPSVAILSRAFRRRLTSSSAASMSGFWFSMLSLTL